jgi:hypothetical protein
MPVARWQRALEARQCTVAHLHDRTEEARAHVEKCLSVSSKWPDGTVTAEERDGWLLAGKALDRGLIGTSQLIAIKE